MRGMISLIYLEHQETHILIYKNLAKLHDFKRKFGDQYIEFIGEFDLVNKKVLSHTTYIMGVYRKVRKIFSKKWTIAYPLFLFWTYLISERGEKKKWTIIYISMNLVIMLR